MLPHDFNFFTRVVKMGGDLMAQWVLRIAQILELPEIMWLEVMS